MSFLSDYREFAKGSEAHPTYHTFSALVALSSIISRRVWIDQGYFTVYPNLYVVLVGPAGNRKTSAMSIAKALIRDLKDIPFSAESVTKEKLVLDIQANETQITSLPANDKHKIYSPMTIMVTELSEFLGMGGVGMINFLVTIYDQDFYDMRTKNKGDSLITGPFLNLLACTTPDWITTYLRSDIISGGFSRRAIFVLETGKAGRIPFPEVTPEAKAAWDRVKAHAQKLFKVAGPFKWEPDAKSFYENWYKSLEMPTDETVSGYYETKHMQLLKVAMLIALSESTDLVMRKSHIESGLLLLQLAEDNLSRVFAGIGRNELNAAAQKVMDIMGVQPTREFIVDGKTNTAPIVTEKKLIGMLYRIVNQQEMDSVLRHLIDTDRLGRVTSPPTAESPIARNYIYLRNK